MTISLAQSVSDSLEDVTVGDYSGLVSDYALTAQSLFDEIAATVEVLCEDTEALPRHEWLALRRQGLGGSDVAAALSVPGAFKSAVALWLDKTGQIPDEDDEREILKRGRQLEGPIATMFAEETGLEVIHLPVMLRSRQHPFMLANPDRFISLAVGVGSPSDLAIVEIKNVGSHNAHEWEDGPPLKYRLQGMHYLYVCGPRFRWCYFVALIGGSELVIYLVERDDELLASMIQREEAFWTLVTMRRMPAIDESPSTNDALKTLYSRPQVPTKEVGTQILGLIERRVGAKELERDAKARVLAVENEMLALIGEAEAVTVDGQVVATWKQTARKGYTVEPTTFRQLHVPTKKEK